MTRSANEVAVLAAKAARGAGAPPEQARMFGEVAVRHLAAGHGAEDLTRALEALPDGPILTLPLAIDDLAGMTGATRELALGPDEAPLAPIYASLLPLQLVSAQVRRTPDTTLVVQLGDAAPPGQTLPPRILVPDALVAMFEALAAKTLVPASEASRLAGAGAGLTDND